MRTLDFSDHRRDLDDNRYVYAVVSRRARGLSIGINLHPCGTCNFACGYCQVDRSTARPPPARLDADRLTGELDGLLRLVHLGLLWSRPPFDSVDPSLQRVADIAFAGDGEPTAHPDFPEALDIVVAVRDRAGLGPESPIGLVPIRVLTNASQLAVPRVASAIDRLHDAGGEIWVKLDAGSEETYRRINRSAVPFSKLLHGIAATAIRHPIVVQSLFSRVHGQIPDTREIDAWSERLADILRAGGRIREVQVTTVARRPSDPAFEPIDLDELTRIASRATRLGLRASVHPAPAPKPEAQT